MPTTDKSSSPGRFTRKVVSTNVIERQPNDEQDKLLDKTSENESFEHVLHTDLTESTKADDDDYEMEYVWRNIIFFIFMHLLVPYSFIKGYLEWKWYLLAWHTLLGYMAGLGVTAGAHRLWSHRSYQAHWTVRLFLAFWFTVAGQNDIYEWCRDHRVHHKWSETHADPHNSNRGFFFAHMGWLCCRKHKQVFEKGATLDFNDLLEDPIVRFHKKYYKILYVLCVYLIPSYLTVVLFGETWFDGFAQSMVRYCFSLHVTWLVNSAAHMWGYRPYNDRINPKESPFVIWSGLLGEGYHNYHHSFPFDYRASEFGFRFQMNLSCIFIEAMEKLGLAWNLRKASEKVVESAKLRVKENELKQMEESLKESIRNDSGELKDEIVTESSKEHQH